MRKQDIILTQSRAVIGDAALKLFRIGQTEPPSRKDGEKLIHMHVYYECHVLMMGDPDGNTIYASDEIYGNELSHTLTFEGLAGKEGTLLIEMKEAHLYAIGAEM